MAEGSPGAPRSRHPRDEPRRTLKGTIEMPSEETRKRARRDRAGGRAPSTQAGKFVREEIHHIRGGKHGASSAKQAIAIGLSKARRAGVALPPPAPGRTSEKTRRSAEAAYELGQGKRAGARPSAKRARATSRALKAKPRAAASHQALSRQGHAAAARRSAASRSAAAERAVRTKGPRLRAAAAKKAARTRRAGRSTIR